MAEALVAEGARVVVVGRDPDALSDVVDALGVQCCRAVAADVTHPGTAHHVLEVCRDAFGGPDVLVNNAGGATGAPMGELDDDAWHEAFELNFFSAVRMTAECVPHMAATGWGRLVHIASISAREPDPYFAPYSAAKAALVNFSTSLAQAWGPQGVTSSCVLAGVTNTGMVKRNAAAAAHAQGSTPDDVMAATMRRHRVPLGRFGEPREVGAAVVFLAGATAGWINGATLEVDGGTLRSV